MGLLKNDLLQKLLKFGLVGLSGMFLDFFITWYCKEKVGLNKYFANAAGFCIAVMNNFCLNYLWTFEGGNSFYFAFGLFFLFAMIGLALNTFLIYLLNDLWSINFYLSKCLAIIGVFLWNFSANYFFNFSTGWWYSLNNRGYLRNIKICSPEKNIYKKTQNRQHNY